MKIKRFESASFNLTNYTPEIEEKIQKFNASVDKIRYYISTPDDKTPLGDRHYTSSIEEALNNMNKLNDNWKDNFCIFEAKVKALTKEEIEIYLNSKKYKL